MKWFTSIRDNSLLPAAVACFSGAICLFASTSLFAHVNWFIEPQGHDQNRDALIQTFSSNDSFFYPGIALIIAALVCAGIFNTMLAKTTLQTRQFAIAHESTLYRIAEIFTGCTLFSTALANNLIAPHLSLNGSDNFLFLALEAIVGILLISGIGIQLACGLLLGLMMSLPFIFNTVSLFEYFNIIGLIVLFFTRHKNNINAEAKSFSLAVMRICLGIGLVTLGFTEKLLRPDLALDFINHFPGFNFMKSLGFAFEDRLFVFCAGCAEVLFGLVYILGFVTRINTAVLAVFLVASNSYFLALDRPDAAMKELIGHAPLFAAALLLICFGGGSVFAFTKQRASTVGAEEGLTATP